MFCGSCSVHGDWHCLESLHVSALEKGPDAHQTGDLQIVGLSGWLSLSGALAVHVGLSWDSVELDMQLSDFRNAHCCSWSQEKPQ